MYLKYDEYVGMGGGAEEGAFARLEAKARAQLDRVTFGRLQNPNEISQNVKYCMYDMIGAIEADEASGTMAAGREIASMSNDGVSISFATGSGGAKSSAARYAAIARSWLANETTACGIPLLYAEVGMA